MEAFSRYVPIAVVAVAIINLVVFYFRATRLSKRSPEKRVGYHLIDRTFSLYFGALTLLWAAGLAFHLGNVVALPGEQSVMQKLQPTSFDWFFLAVSVFVLLRFSVWLYVRDGAAFLVAHSDIFRSFPKSPVTVKVLWALMLIGCAISIVRRFTA